ncbi:MAG: hypothetical protein BJ554DRAFT_8435 [Olpidium bornovanus]|uniref:Xanthine dehydrogenase n=1 Tax=Olpidium bornovanus TaxID=278681 RepID=A0A8H7ZUX9_9FUNG|nr:MAG: hypothetical protein BJ554DRAFT_8435 [Olpidium bornovanus]
MSTAPPSLAVGGMSAASNGPSAPLPPPPPPSATLTFYVNAARVELENPSPELTLLAYLRSVGLTGTKLGCAEGGCGACTVLVSFYDEEARRVKHTSVNACLAPLCSLDGKHVITVEGIGTYDNPHPAQERIALMFGSQCGFCTPGIVMALYALLRNNPSPTEGEIEDCFDGNLCRCTGYRPILDAAKTFACDKRNAGCCGGNACGRMLPREGKPSGLPTGCGEMDCCQTQTDFCSQEENHAFPKPSQDVIFPPALLKYAQSPKKFLEFTSRRCKWIRPNTIDELLEVKRRYPQAKLVAGNTEVGIEVKFRRLKYPVLIYVADIAELCCRKENGMYVSSNRAPCRLWRKAQALDVAQTKEFISELI